MLTQRKRHLAVWIGSLALAGILVYLALRRSNLAEIGAAFSQAKYWWCVPLAFITIGSHLVRAWRWQALLEALPPGTNRPRLTTAFGSVMIGFMVNYVLPRVGEFVRAGNLSRREKLPYSGVLGTIFTERVIDLVTFALGAVLSVLILTGEQRVSLHERMLQPAVEGLSPVSAVGMVSVVVLAAVLAWWILAKSPLRHLVATYVAPLWTSFLAGIATAHRSPRKAMLITTTVVIWLMYGLMAYIPLEMFSMAAPYSLTFVDAVVIMFVGVLGVIIPTPGGVGSFHYVTILTLTVFYGVPESLAATYAVFVHGAQLILYLALGLLILTIQDTKLAQLRVYAQRPGRQDT